MVIEFYVNSKNRCNAVNFTIKRTESVDKNVNTKDENYFKTICIDASDVLCTGR